MSEQKHHFWDKLVHHHDNTGTQQPTVPTHPIDNNNASQMPQHVATPTPVVPTGVTMPFPVVTPTTFPLATQQYYQQPQVMGQIPQQQPIPLQQAPYPQQQQQYAQPTTAKASGERTLRVEVLEGSGVQVVESIKDNDPFVVLEVKHPHHFGIIGHKAETQIKEGATSAPVWNEVHDLTIRDSSVDKLIVKAKDKSGHISDSIGTAEVPLSDLSPNQPKDTWVKLDPSGRLHLVLILDPVGPAVCTHAVEKDKEPKSLQEKVKMQHQQMEEKEKEKVLTEADRNSGTTPAVPQPTV